MLRSCSSNCTAGYFKIILCVAFWQSGTCWGLRIKNVEWMAFLLITIFIMSTTIYWLYYLSLIDYWAPVTVSAALNMWQFNSHKIHFPPDSWRKWDSEGSRDVLWVTVNSEMRYEPQCFSFQRQFFQPPHHPVSHLVIAMFWKTVHGAEH